MNQPIRHFFSVLAISAISIGSVLISGCDKQVPKRVTTAAAPTATETTTAPAAPRAATSTPAAPTAESGTPQNNASNNIASAANTSTKAVVDANNSGVRKFVPPDESTIPNNEYGKTVLMGKNIFVDTQKYAKSFVGNGLNCVNCHLDNGRKADSSPLWAAYVLYPAFRKKTGQVDTIGSRIQGCFLFSMNGKPPALDSKEMTALVTYTAWLAHGAPTGVKLPGQGYVTVSAPAQKPDLARGKEVYKNNCALCHGANGEGTKANGVYAFPPLWGKDSFNWGAGMHKIDTAAGFIKVNMPYGRGGTLSDQEAWDVALFMNSHERPEDPRFKQSKAHTRDTLHDEYCLYDRTPTQLEVLLEKKADAKARDKQAEHQSSQPPVASVPLQTEGYSPTTSQ